MAAQNKNSSAASTSNSTSNSSSSTPPPPPSSDYDGIFAGGEDESKDYDNSPPAPPPSNSDSSSNSAPPPDANSPPSSNTDPPETSPPPENSSASPNTPSPPSPDSSPQSSPSGSGSGSGSPPSTPKQQSPPSPPPPKPSNKQQSPPPPSSPSQESSSSSQSPPQNSPTPSPPPPTSSGRSSDSSQNNPSPPQPSPETSKSPPRPSNSTSSTPPSPVVSSPSANNNNNNASSPGLSPKAIAPSARNPTKSATNNNSSGGSNASSSSGVSSDSGGSSHNSTKQTSINEVAVGVTVATVFIFVLLAFFCFKKKKKKIEPSPYANYMPPPANFGVTSDAYMGHSTQHDAAYYNSQLHGQQSNYVNSFGSTQGGQNYHGHDSGIIAGSKTFFSYEDLMEMTNGFARQNIIGEGGFGTVYKGWTPDGRLVAVKQLKAGSGQGEREFRAEVEIISRVHHRHLVSLVGYSVAENQKLLIYEFVPNNTLEHHLHAKDLPVLEWVKRVKIAVGAAKGLAYLHEDCHPKIIHRDIKSANILLDDDFEAQVADFGLARLNDTTQTHVSTRVMGTFGYLAPEYASSGKLTDRSDVYSFGVVLLELITGRKPVDPTRPLGDESLVEWARPLLIQALETGDFGELIDARLENRYVQSQMFRMIEAAAACVRHSAVKRPRMALVVRALDFEGDSDDLSNGVKVGQSTVYDSGQYNEEILKFRRLALASDMSSEFEMYSGEYKSRDVVSSGQQNSWNSQYSSGDYTSGELETKAFNPNGSEYSGASGYYGGGGGGRFK